MTGERYCPRCKTAPLLLLPQSDEAIRFFRCPQCQRQFAQSPGQELTERWGGALSLALYGVIFSTKPQAEAGRIAALLCTQQKREALAWMEREIRLELASPTQQVRDILDLRASEQDLREFLALVADKIHEELQKQP
jgi:hypothetical protein